jgi:hypothetical protein
MVRISWKSSMDEVDSLKREPMRDSMAEGKFK